MVEIKSITKENVHIFLRV